MEVGIDVDVATQDLGPLAWVLDELRKSLDSASSALRRFVRDAALARGTDMASVDGGQLRIARQQFHQAVGALEMVGLVAPAHLLRSMEAAVQKFSERPDLCNEQSSAKVERAGLALTEYLEAVLRGKPASAVALFPQYKDTQELAGADRVHPADLWSMEWRWVEPRTLAAAEAIAYEPAIRQKLDQSVLRLVKSGDPAAARELGRLSLGLAASQSAREPKIFWKICAAYFEAVGSGLLPLDLYVKRAGSRILLQYASLAKGELGVSDRLAQDLVFFCSQAVPADAAQAPALAAVRSAWELTRFAPVDYLTPQYGRFDPMLLAQARKRMAAAKESWSALAGGDANKLRGLAEQFSLLGDALVKLHPQSAPLAEMLSRVVQGVVLAARPPDGELAMEVATAVLYLEAALEELDTPDAQLGKRMGRLAERLDAVRQGGRAEPLESWMAQLYGRVSDRQTMGSVVGELRGALGELEKLLDQHFRDPQDKSPLLAAPNHLAQMRGVLSVLGLEHAAQAVQRMHESVEQILAQEETELAAITAGAADALANNLGALGLLIDMLSYQPALARTLFVYSEATGELRPVMGATAAAAATARAARGASELAAPDGKLDAALIGLGPVSSPAELQERLDALATQAVLAEKPVMASAVREAAAALAQDPGSAASALGELVAAVLPTPAAAPPSPVAADIQEDDLLEIFLEEAREVVTSGLAAIEVLHGAPADVSAMTTLRRAFHTLKGSSRMVGLSEFGDAAWSMEQVLNTWMADQKPAEEGLRVLALQAMQGFARWIEDIGARRAAGAWNAETFRRSADALRLEGRLVALAFSVAPAAAQPEPVADIPGDISADISADVPAESAAPRVELAVEAFTADRISTAHEQTERAEPDAELVTSDPLEMHEQPEVLAVDLSFDVPALSSTQSVTTEAAAEEFTLTFDGVSWPEVSLGGAPDVRADFAEVHEPESPPPGLPLDLDLELEPSEYLEARAPAEPAVEFSQTFTLEAGDLDSHGEFELKLPEAGVLESLGNGLLGGQLASMDLDPLDAEGSEGSKGADEMSSLPAQAEPAIEEPVAPIAAPVFDDADDQIKVVGSLRIGIPLYNVYLNEADEWSRRLAAEIDEWALEPDQRVPDSTVGLAHALAGSSATVGFESLSDIARALETALGRTQGLAYGTAQHGRAFTDAAEEIRRLLHQFAAGFLKAANPSIVEALTALQGLEIPPRAQPVGSDPYGEFDEDEAPPASNASLPATVDPTAPSAPTSVSGMDAVTSPSVPAAATALGATRDAPQPLEDAPIEPPAAAGAPLSAGLAPALTLVPAANTEAQAVTALAVEHAEHVEQDLDRDLDLDVVDAVDPDLFGIFEEEASELMPRLGGALRQWSARPENRSARDEVLRVLHTLKGSARLAGALRLGELAHRMESEIETLGYHDLAAADIEPLLHRFDGVQVNLDGLRARGGMPAAETAPALSSALEEPGLDSVPAQVESPLDEAQLEPDAAASAPQAGTDATAARRRDIAPPVTSNIAPQRASANHSVRVRSQLLDRLMNQAGEVMITRSRLESELRQLRGSLNDLTGNLDRLRSQLRDIELQAETQMQSRLAQSKDSGAGFDPLEFDRFTRVQELTRMMAESVNDVATVQRNIQRVVESTEDDLVAQGRQTRELQRDLLRTRMMEFEGIADRLYGVVRLAAKETGKQVKLDIVGGSIEVDRGVLDRMAPAFEHLLRNCVAHGIEDAQARREAGKNPVGTITISLHQEGNDVSVEFRDDGAGLNLQRIREKAVQLGRVRVDQELSDAEAAQMIFMPGFSTALQVTELAGRGIGMDVVRAEVNALGGRIETSTTAGQGTCFKLVLPLTTAVTQVVMIRAGNLTIGVPANLIEMVRRSTPKEVEQSHRSSTYEFAGQELPFYWAGALLQASQHSTEPQGKTLPVVIFRSAAQRVAVQVDEVLGNQEVVVKNLGPQLARLPGLSGMTVLASGAVVLIYNPVALTTVYGGHARRLSGSGAEVEVVGQRANEPGASATGIMPATASIPLVLVVDDSITVRRVTQRLLQREGYRVALAADGLQALERLAEEQPALVLSDIEMPRMDGFDLVRNIRSDERLKDLPVIMITSRIAQKHREHAKELGVDHYLGKPYAEEELLSLVKHYSSTTVPA